MIFLNSLTALAEMADGRSTPPWNPPPTPLVSLRSAITVLSTATRKTIAAEPIARSPFVETVLLILEKLATLEKTTHAARMLADPLAASPLVVMVLSTLVKIVMTEIDSILMVVHLFANSNAETVSSICSTNSAITEVQTTPSTRTLFADPIVS